MYELHYRDVAYKSNLKGIQKRNVVFLVLIIGVMTIASKAINEILVVSVGFIALLFFVNFQRQKQWTRYALLELRADQNKLYLKVRDKNVVREYDLMWSEVLINTGSTFNRFSRRFFTISRNNGSTVLKLFADTQPEIDNQQILSITSQLKEFQESYS